MTDLHRTTIYVTEQQWDRLRDIAHEQRTTISELIREAIDTKLSREAFGMTAQQKFQVRYYDEVPPDNITHTDMRRLVEYGREGLTIHHGSFVLTDEQDRLTSTTGEWLYVDDGVSSSFAIAMGGDSDWTDDLREGPVETQREVLDLAENLIDMFLNDTELWESLK